MRKFYCQCKHSNPITTNYIWKYTYVYVCKLSIMILLITIIIFNNIYINKLAHLAIKPTTSRSTPQHSTFRHILPLTLQSVLVNVALVVVSIWRTHNYYCLWLKCCTAKNQKNKNYDSNIFTTTTSRETNKHWHCC